MRKVIFAFIFASAALPTLSATAKANIDVSKVLVPKGFSVSIYAEDVTNARQMALGDKGTIFVGSRKAGLVHALVDSNNDGKADKKYVIAKDLFLPSGLAFRNGNLYVAEVNQVLEFTDIESHLAAPKKPKVVVGGLPKEGHHGWKYIDFGPEGDLYVPIGAPCNICETNGGKDFDDARFSSILKFNLSTGEQTWVAKGVRNSVGFDWHPETKELWFTDNGRDWMGDDTPPCEINRVSAHGQHFGYPYFHGGTIADPEFGKGKKAEDYVHPAINLGAHVAPLGAHFYQGDMFPANYKNALFVAEHGSWNRSKKVGYRVMVATIKDNQVVDYQPFMQGWLNKEKTLGRPVAFLPLNDGSLLVSDDFANVIYRVTYNSNKS